MKSYLKIQSKGEIETNAFTLIGASSKRNDETKIGYFGSGLKYSISALLRNDISFKVYQGEKEIIFDLKRVSLREEEHTMILVNGSETSLTTGMGGKDWDIPFAPIREIYSNALDEDEDATIDDVKTELYGVSGFTTFYIEMTEDVKHFYENIELYFCSKNPNVLYSGADGSIYPKSKDGGLRVFRKGILCHSDSNDKSLFTYNLTDINITESRTMKSMNEVIVYSAHLLKSCKDINIITQILRGLEGGNSGYFEHRVYWEASEKFSDEWLEVCKNYKFVPIELLSFLTGSDTSKRMKLPIKLLENLKKQFPDLDVLGISKNNKNGIVFVKDDSPSEILIDKVIDGLSVLRQTRYKHRLSEPIIEYGSFTRDNVLGMASEGKILLSVKLDTYDVPAIAKIIIEENEHNKSGFGDRTREFQDHLFNLYYDELTSKKKTDAEDKSVPI